MSFTRRQALAALAAPLLAQKAPTKIKDVQTMTLKGPRTYLLVKVLADDGAFGIGEAYGTPGVGVKEQILSLKPWLVGKDPLEIDALFSNPPIRCSSPGVPGRTQARARFSSRP